MQPFAATISTHGFLTFTLAYKRMRIVPAGFGQTVRENGLYVCKGENMTATRWTQVAAMAAALGLTGVAIAQNTEGTTNPRDRASVSSSSIDTPSSGAIVTPEDKALGMGHDDARAGTRNGDEDASTSNADALSVNPPASNDDALSVNPPPTNDEDSSIDPGESRTGSDAQPGDMGPASMRGE